MIVPGLKNCDVRNIHWLEVNAKISAHLGSNPLYYQLQDSKFKKRRLITTGLNGLIIEWDLKT